MDAIHSLTTLLDSIAGVSLAAWLFRITVLTTLACMYLALARRAQPALRHAVAVASLVAVVLLPLASKLLPSVNLPVLRAPVVASTKVDPSPVTIDVASDSAPTRVYIATPTTTKSARIAAGVTKPQITTARGLLERGYLVARTSVLSARNWIRFALVMWVLVATLLLARLALASARVFRIARRAPLIDDEFLRVEMERACRALRVTRWIDIAVSNEIAVPMVIGAFSPRIVLPSGAQHWPRERMSVVLLHEIAHIRRRDCVFMLFAQMVSAVLWFHPAVVRLSRDVRRESERSCDDLVLATGIRGSDYAEHLVSIARLSARRDSLSGAALAFAARSTLEQRVASILGARPRHLDARVIGATAAAAVALFAGTAAVHPTHAAPEPAALAEPVYTYSFSSPAADNAHAKTIKVKTPSAVAPMTSIPATTVSGYQFQLSEEKQEKLQCKIDSRMRKRTETRIRNDVQNGIKYQLAGTDDNESDGESWYDRAHSYYQRHSYDRAGHAYENAARFGFESAKAFYNAGCSYALAGQSDAAIEMLENALHEGFDDPDKYATDDDLTSLRGDARFKNLLDEAQHSDTGQQNLRAAEHQYEQLGYRRNVDHGDWNAVGIDLMRAGEYDRAVAAFDNEFKVSQDNDAIYNKACARALQGKSSDALDLLEQSIAAGSADTDHMRADTDLLSLHADKRFDGLVDLARDLDLSDSWKHDMAIWKGNEQERWADVLPRYEAVAKEHPKIGLAWFNLGFIQLRAEQPQKSSASFQKALDLGYRTPTTLYNLACSSAQSDQRDAAFTWLAKAESAGFDVGNSAPSDDDLDPLKGDPRWKEMKTRWKSEEAQKKYEKDVKKYD